MNLHETVNTSDYWTDEEKKIDIVTREVLALNKALASFSNILKNAWVDAQVDNRVAVEWSLSREEGVRP